MADSFGPRLRSSSYLYHYSHFPLNYLYPLPPSFNYSKARWDEYLTYIDTHCPPPFNFITLSLSEATHLPNFSIMLPLLPFLSAASTALLKPGGLLKSQMPSRNAERHLQRHTVLKKTARTISPLLDIPPL